MTFVSMIPTCIGCCGLCNDICNSNYTVVNSILLVSDFAVRRDLRSLERYVCSCVDVLSVTFPISVTSSGIIYN